MKKSIFSDKMPSIVEKIHRFVEICVDQRKFSSIKENSRRSMKIRVNRQKFASIKINWNYSEKNVLNFVENRDLFVKSGFCRVNQHFSANNQIRP